MSNVPKRDNSDLASKLELRRLCLKAWHDSSPITVLDCCAGQNHLWHELRAEFPVKYVGLDKMQKGTANVKIDSTRWLRSVSLVAYDVIDVDAYGEPWPWWVDILSRATRDVTVFLTCGAFGSPGRSQISKLRKTLAGIPEDWQLPMSDAVAMLLTERCLGALYAFGLGCAGAYEIKSRTSGTYYYGIRLTSPKSPE